MDELAFAADVLLRVCAAPDEDHCSRFARLSASDWEWLADAAVERRVAPLLHRSLILANAQDMVPAAAFAKIDEAQKWHALYGLRQGVAISRLLGLLANEGYRPIVLKGLGLAYSCYPNPGLRPLRDVDLLLDEAEAVEAQKLLLKTPGYRYAPWAGRYGPEYGHQLPELQDEELGLTIEVHHRINARGWAHESLLLDKIRGEAEALTLVGLEVLVPSLEANLLHMIEHATLHHGFENGPLVLADLHFIAATRTIDWRSIKDQAGRMGLANALQLMVALAHSLGARWMPEWLAAESRSTGDYLRVARDTILADQETIADRNMMIRLGTSEDGRTGWAAALGRALRPDPYALAWITGGRADSPLRWVAYPVWVVRRGINYLSARRSSDLALTAERHKHLTQWLFADQGGAPRGGPMDR